MVVKNDFQGFSGWISQPLQQQMQRAEEIQPESTEAESHQGLEDQPVPGDPGYNEFYAGLLKDAPDEHKSILEPYIKKFDAGVQRRFQDLHARFKPYANLDWDEETVGQVSELYRIINEEPERLYEVLKEQYGSEDGKEQIPTLKEGESSPDFSGLPPEVKAQLEQQQQVLEALASYVLQDHNTKQETVEDQELDNYLGLLEKEYGEFDKDYVLTKIANGMDGEKAVKSWQTMIQNHLNKAGAATAGLPPTVLSSAGGGAVPSGEVQNLAEISSKDIRNLIANVLGQANQSGS